jgi:heat shock protein HtpX
VVSPKALIEGLRTVHGVALAFQAFWQNEFAPVISSGYRPPLMEGFSQFIHAPSVARLMSQTVEQELDKGETNPYDTHPTLRERIAALQTLPSGSEDDDPIPALSLLEDVPGLKQAVFAHVFGPAQVGSWQRIDWQNVGPTVYLPVWKKTLNDYAPALQGVTPGTLSAFLKSPEPLAQKLRDSVKQTLGYQQLQNAIQHVVGQALGVALANQGWTIKVAPGEEITLEKEGLALEPFVLISDIISGKLSAEAWQRQCEEAKITHLDLGIVVG